MISAVRFHEIDVVMCSFSYEDVPVWMLKLLTEAYAEKQGKAARSAIYIQAYVWNRLGELITSHVDSRTLRIQYTYRYVAIQLVWINILT